MSLAEIDALIATNHTQRRDAEEDGRFNEVAELEQEYQRLLDDWSLAYLMQRFISVEPIDP